MGHVDGIDDVDCVCGVKKIETITPTEKRLQLYVYIQESKANKRRQLSPKGSRPRNLVPLETKINYCWGLSWQGESGDGR